MPLPPGTRLGPYELASLLGMGGMGEVYKARDTRLDRSVAVKVLPARVAADPDLRARFEREARAIAALDHPHICALHDVGHADGIDFLVMRLLEGETLAARVTRGPMPLDQVVRHGAEIADALDKAHRVGITHRDLKPANVMLTKTGAMLLDFGLAKLHGPAAPIGLPAMRELGPTSVGTAKGTLLGTLHYMAPEQVEGAEADPRSDIFALGAVVYEMATGMRPFGGDSPASVIGAILKDDPPPVSASQPLSPPALDHVVARCLAKDPDERWQSAADVKHELLWALKSGQRATTDSAGPRRIGPLGWVTIAVLGGALAVTSPYAVRQWLSRTPVPAGVRFDVFPPDNASFTALGAAVPTTQLAVSPDGRRLAFVATAQGGRPMVWVRSLDTLEARELPGTEGAVFPFWSPDSRLIGFFAQGKLKRTDLVGSPPQAICDASPESTRGATWSRDGIIVFAPNSASGLLQVSAGGGVPAPAIRIREGDSSYRWPTFLPDGRHLLFYVRGSAGQRGLYVGSIGGTAMTRLLETVYNGLYASGYLLTLRDRSLLAYPFDEQGLRITGDPMQVAENVGGSSTQLAAFSASPGGVLAHTPGFTTSSRLMWFDRDGRPQGQLTDVGDYPNFRFSADEQRLAFTQVDPVTQTQDIWLVDTARGVPTRFTFDPLHDLSPIWSPDGKRIMFRSDRTGGNQPFEKASTGAEAERLVAPLEVTFPTDWSPDGKYVLYYSLFDTTLFDVMALPLFGDRTPIPLAQSGFQESSPRFSPDGRWFAYTSDESGRSEIYVQPFAQTGAKTRVSANGGFEPRWRRDGRELSYLALDGMLTAVPVNVSTTFEHGAPQRLFQTRVPFLGSSLWRSSYEVTGDGRRFLVNTLADDAGPSPITVVLNWTTGLGR